MGLPEGLVRLGRALREGDWTGAASLASRRTGLVRFDRMLILEVDLGGRPAPPEPGRSGGAPIRVTRAAPASLSLLTDLFPHSASRYADRFRRGDECLLAELEGGPAGMGWIGLDRGTPRELGCRIQLPDRACWEYDMFVLARHRRRGVFAALIEAMIAELNARGMTRLYAAVDHLNAASRASHARLGYGVAAVLDRFILAGRQRHRVTWPSGRRERLRSVGGEGPVLRIS